MSEDGKALKSDRRKCYQARDSYFSCTDTLLDSGKSEKEAEKACSAERKAFETNCPSSWVGHFVRKHNFERYKAQLIEQGSSPVSRAVAAAAPTLPPSHRSKTAAAATSPSELLQKQQLQQLWELSKVSREELNPITRQLQEDMKKGGVKEVARRFSFHMKSFSDINDFASVAKLLDLRPDKNKAPKVAFVIEVMRTALLAKSLGSLPPSILQWIEDAVRRLPEPLPGMKESIIWLLTILRGDLPMLQQLHQESLSNNGVVGPLIDRVETVRSAALLYLEAGKKKESLWTSTGTHLLAEEELVNLHHLPALLHYALLRSSRTKKPDSWMLRWYTESLVAHQRTPIPENPQFKMMMEPVIRAFGGKIEKWEKGDRRVEELRKWRNDYTDAELNNLVKSMVHFMKDLIENGYGSSKDVERLERMLMRLERINNGNGNIVIDWLNYKIPGGQSIKDVLPSYSLVVVGREKNSLQDTTIRSPRESQRVKVMDVTKKKEKKQEVDDICTMILSVASRGHLLSNDRTRPHFALFHKYLRDNSKDVSQSTLLKNYLNDAALRHNAGAIQQPVDYSRAAQWIDKEKKELAFTVARKYDHLTDDTGFRAIDHYSLHID